MLCCCGLVDGEVGGADAAVDDLVDMVVLELVVLE